MRRLRTVIGGAVLVGGLLIAVGPFVSVWRVGGQVLDELPDLEGVEQSDERLGWSAMFDDEFIVARRTLEGTDERTVTEALVADGFESLGMAGFSKECCGDYDAVWADLQDGGTESVVVELIPADSDWQLTWPLFTGFGSLMAVVGAAVVASGRSASRDPVTAAVSA